IDRDATPIVIRLEQNVAENCDAQIGLHVETLKEGRFIGDTMRAIGCRPYYMYHSGVAGGGDGLDCIQFTGRHNGITVSTNLTLHYTVYTIDEQPDMVIVAHNLRTCV